MSNSIGKALAYVFVLFGCVCSASAQTNHTVVISGHTFTPANLTIQAGDQVTWVWNAAFHDVTSGTNGVGDGIFASGLQLATGVTFSVTFDRNFLRSNASIVAPNNSGAYTFPYYCSPHYLMGMIGIITVTSQSQAFSADVQASQVVPATTSADSGHFALNLSANEKQLTISGTDSVASGQIDLTRAAVGENGFSAIATVDGTAGSVNQTISFTASQADDLYAGNLYLLVRSADFPTGAVRGQIVKSDAGTRSISGQILTAEHVGVPNVVVSDGVQSTTTDIMGEYTLSGVSNGVYTLTATLSGYHITADIGTNPLLVNSADAAGRDFTAQAVTLAPIVQIISPAPAVVVSSFDVEVTYATRDNAAATYVIDGHVGTAAVSGGGYSLTLNNGTHALQMSAGSPPVTATSSFTVRSPLTAANLKKVIALTDKSLRAPSAATASKLWTTLSQMDAGGSMSPVTPKLKKVHIDKALALSLKLKTLLTTHAHSKQQATHNNVVARALGLKLEKVLRAMQ